MSAPKITFIGAGSATFVKSILGDVFHRDAFKSTRIALMDLDPMHLEESHAVVRKLADSAGVSGRITCYADQEAALQNADFVVITFQINDYEPCTVTDFTACKRHDLEQTIANMLGPNGIVRALCTTPHLWQTCEDMTEIYPQATMLNYANPMTINTQAMYAYYPHIKQVGLCHSVQGTTKELARDSNIGPAPLHYRSAGVNHMTFYLELERKTTDSAYVDLYPELLTAYESGRAPRPNIHRNTRCQNIVRCEMFRKLEYFVIEPSGHFAEYTSWFTKPERENLIERYRMPLDEYSKHCAEQLANQKKELEKYKAAERIDVKPSREYASTIMNTIWTDEPSVIYGNVRNDNLIGNLSQGYYVEIACLVDVNGIQPTRVGTLPSHLAAMVWASISVQTLLTETILTESRDCVCHAAIMDPHTAAVLGVEEIYVLMDDLTASHGDWLPAWLHRQYTVIPSIVSGV